MWCVQLTKAVHLRSRISQCFPVVHFSYIFVYHFANTIFFDVDDKKCISAQYELGQARRLIRTTASWASVHQQCTVPYCNGLPKVPCFWPPINWWIKSSPSGVVFTNFRKSTAVATTFNQTLVVIQNLTTYNVIYLHIRGIFGTNQGTSHSSHLNKWKKPTM